MAKLKTTQTITSLKQFWSREEVRELLKKQIKKVRNSVGKMDANAGDMEIFNRIKNCGIVKF